MKIKKEYKMRQSEQAALSLWRLSLKAVKGVLAALLTILIIGCVAGCIVVGAFALYISGNVDMSVDDIVMVSNDTTYSTKLYYYDSDGNLVENESQSLSAGTISTWVSYKEIPEDLVDAFVAIEDKRFWDHNGVDWITTIKSAAKFFLPLGSGGGGSTITQQLVKNVTGDNEYSIQRKVQEIFKAINLEKVKDKTEIMEMYLNIIYLSQGANGVQEAAKIYFDKDVSELTLLECCAIAGITQSPTYWDPIQNPDNNVRRRNEILNQMLIQGMITQAEYDENYNAELVINVGDTEEDNTSSSSDGYTTWYTDAVIYEAVDLLQNHYGVTKKVAEQLLYTGGYSIVTAMDPEVQAIMDKYYLDVSETSILPTNGIIIPESSMIIMDPYTGNIVGLVGGRGEKNGNLLLNRATQTTRSPGSSIKPIAAYAFAMDLGLINYSSVMDDTPYTFGTVTLKADGKSYSCSMPGGWPRNSGGTYQGIASMVTAVSKSKNTIAVKLVDMIGIDNVFTFLKNKLHLDSLVERVETQSGVRTDKTLSALALGGMTYGLTLKELVAAYTIFPTGGVYNSGRTVIKILDKDGNTLIDNDPISEVVIKEETAQMMTKLLRTVISNYGGTAYHGITKVTKLAETAGKTGTTDENNDKWFVGYTPYYLGGVWYGFDIPANLASYSTTAHMEIWDTIMRDVHELKGYDKRVLGDAVRTFEDDLLIEAEYCVDSGKLLTNACHNDLRKLFNSSTNRVTTGYFTKYNLPTEVCDVHVMVDWCEEGHGVACDACIAAGTTKRVGMLNIVREFPSSIYVTDAEFVWRDLGDVAPYQATSTYFFKNLLPVGYYAGTVSIGSSRRNSGEYLYNRMCAVHYVPVESEQQ